MLCPSVHPVQLAYLYLEFLCIVGVKQDRLLTAVAAVSYIPQLLNSTHLQVVTGTSAAAPAVLQRYAERCLEYIWLGLGKQLQQASGVAEAELEGDGAQAAAAEAAAAAGDAGSSRWLDSTSRMEGGELRLPADAAGRLQMVWGLYSKCLFEAHPPSNRAKALFEGGCRR
jgi:hypothetical protein